MTSKSVIYQTHGRAAEYCPLAINLFYGCPHGCRYCYASDVTHQEPVKYYDPKEVRPRVTALEVARSAEEVSGQAISMRAVGQRQPVLLSFICDPYPEVAGAGEITREVIKALHFYGFPFTVLTKAGALVRRDFDLYQEGDSFATTLTFLDEARSREWEPRAATPDVRLQNLYLAHQAGIATWVSLEPVIDPLQTIAVIYATYPFTDHYKVGKLNARSEELKVIERAIDWAGFAKDAQLAFAKVNRGYYLKKDLGAFIGKELGYREGRQLP